MADRYPGYDVLNKRNSVSWNDQTRTVIDQRMAIDPQQHQFFTDAEWSTIRAVCDRIVPQPAERMHPAPLAAMVDEKLHSNSGDGYRDARLPPMGEAWRRGLAAIDSEAKSRYGRRFHELSALLQDDLLKAVQEGSVNERTWRGLPAKLFFKKRLLHDVVSAYYAHPAAWNEIGFGGPASPRGYVRMNFDRRDPWEAAEAKPGRERIARAENTRVG
ncbi:MAG: gluconate 2-dehydrogenase subunit 3 family protein [Xanthobacteraceae bacterium]